MLPYRKLASNTIFQILARIITSGSSFLITIFIARHFGVIGYGDFAKITAFVSLFYFFTDLGFNAIFLQQKDSHLRFRDLFYTRIIVSLVIVLFIFLVTFFLPYNLHTGIGYSPLVKIGILLFSLTLITESILFSAAAVFQRKLVYEFQFIAGVVGSLLTVILVFVFSLFHFPFLFLVGAFVIGGIFEAGLSLILTDERLLPIKVDTVFIKKITIETLPIAIMLLFNLVYFRVDMILLALFKSTTDVAVYDLSYKVFDFLIAIPLFLSNVLYPSLIVASKIPRIIRSRALFYIVGFLFLGLVTAGVIWFLAPLLQFIKIEFLSAMVPLRILVLSLPIFFATSIMQWIIIAKKQQKFLLFVYSFWTVINIVFNLLFIPHFSYVASAIITDACEVGVFLLLLLKLLK